jgi:prolyl-tRNA editing enzyme YbaK/EbsC (Cys-tRNA(Pro) deacylase)
MPSSTCLLPRNIADRQAHHVIDLFSPGIQSIAQAAARKGVKLDVRLVPLAAFSGEEAAAAVGAQIGQIVRAVVCVARRPGGIVIPVVCLISGRNRLDLDLLRAVAGEPGAREATDRETEAMFGHFVGGMPPFGHGHDVQTIMDQSLGRYEWLWAPAGAESTAIRIAPGTLRMLANAVVAPVAQPSWMRPSATAVTGLVAVGFGIGRAERARRPRIEDEP